MFFRILRTHVGQLFDPPLVSVIFDVTTEGWGKCICNGKICIVNVHAWIVLEQVSAAIILEQVSGANVL